MAHFHFAFGFGPGGTLASLILSTPARLRTESAVRLRGFLIAWTLSPAAAIERSKASSSGVQGPERSGSVISSPLDLLVVLARMQRIEIGDAIDAEDDGLAVDDELLHPVLQRGFNDPRIPFCPVIPVPGEQAHAVAVALNAQPIPVIFDFVEPSARAGTSIPRVGIQNSKALFMHLK